MDQEEKKAMQPQDPTSQGFQGKKTSEQAGKGTASEKVARTAAHSVRFVKDKTLKATGKIKDAAHQAKQASSAASSQTKAVAEKAGSKARKTASSAQTQMKDVASKAQSHAKDAAESAEKHAKKAASKAGKQAKDAADKASKQAKTAANKAQKASKSAINYMASAADARQEEMKENPPQPINAKTMKEAILQYCLSNPNTVLWGFAGALIAFLMLVFGFWPILFIAVLCCLGIAFGQYRDGNPRIVKFIQKHFG